MNQRPILISVKPVGWLGWLVIALLAIPLLILSFFFVAVAALLAAVILALAVGRLYWLQRTARKREPSAYGHGPVYDGVRSGVIIDIEPSDSNDDATPPKSGAQRLP